MVATTTGVMVTGLCGRETIVLEVVDTGTTSGDPKMMLHFIHLKYGQDFGHYLCKQKLVKNLV